MIEDLAQGLVDHLDALDGDADLEDSEGCHHQVDAKGRCINSAPCHGLWYEDAEDDDEDCCLAGDDRVVAGPVIRADVLGFSARTSLYQFGMDEDMESASWPTIGAQCEPPDLRRSLA